MSTNDAATVRILQVHQEEGKGKNGESHVGDQLFEPWFAQLYRRLSVLVNTTIESLAVP
jgi:hypothetical protein